MSQFTKEEWVLDPHAYPIEGFWQVQIVRNGAVMAVGTGHTEAECKERGHLIAAAPEMYEALKAAEQYVVGPAYLLLKDAIKKAEGRA